jgi:acyl carrier protein
MRRRGVPEPGEPTREGNGKAMSQAEADTLEKAITALVAEIVEMDETELWEQRDRHFSEELEIDSMLALEILASVEKNYRIEIPEEDLLDITSLESTIALVRRILKNA